MCPDCGGILFEKGKAAISCGKCDKDWNRADIDGSSKSNADEVTVVASTDVAPLDAVVESN